MTRQDRKASWARPVLVVGFAFSSFATMLCAAGLTWQGTMIAWVAGFQLGAAFAIKLATPH